jgi:hypothetical protein
MRYIDRLFYGCLGISMGAGLLETSGEPKGVAFVGFGVALMIIVAEFIYRRKAMEKPEASDDGYHLNGS